MTNRLFGGLPLPLANKVFDEKPGPSLPTSLPTTLPPSSAALILLPFSEGFCELRSRNISIDRTAPEQIFQFDER